MTEDATNHAVKIGQLLIGVGALTSGDLTEAIQIAKRMGVPIGRVLVMSGCIKEQNLQQVLELQSLIKDGLCDLDVGMAALRRVFKENCDIQTALKSLNWHRKQDANSNKLGDLLVDSMIVSRAELDRALEASFQSGMPLGGTLVLQGVLSAQLLPTILHTQEQIREARINRDQAVESLKQALMFWAKADKSEQESHRNQQTKPAEQSRQRPLPPFKTTDSDHLPDNTPVEVAQNSTAAKQLLPVSLIELMKLTGFCTQESLEESIRAALQDSRLAAQLLMSIGVIDGNILNIIIRCHALIARGVLRNDQAIYVLGAIRHRHISMESALRELDINPAVLES